MENGPHNDDQNYRYRLCGQRNKIPWAKSSQVKYQKEAEYSHSHKNYEKRFWHNQIEKDIIQEKQVFRLNDLLKMYQYLIRG